MLRRANYLDLPAIQRLPASTPGPWCTPKAGASALARDLDTAVIALVLETPDTTDPDRAVIQAFACFGSGPPAHHFGDNVQRRLRKDGWDHLIHCRFEADSLKRINTLFLWRVHCSPAITDPTGFLLQSITSIYTISPRIHHIALLSENDGNSVPAWLSVPVKPAQPSVPVPENPLFSQPTLRPSPAEHDLTLHVNHRSHVLPPLRVRKARVEDCDDLMLPPDAGDYHVAEILESKNPNVLSLVAEANGTAIGFVSASTDVNVSALAQSFALDVYSDLFDVPVQDSAESSKPSQLNRVASVQALGRNISSARQGDQDQGGDESGSGERDDSPALVTMTSANSHHGSIANLAKDMKEAPAALPHPRLFCIDDRYAHHSSEMIRPLFKALPNHDYCLLTQPTQCREPALLVAPGGGGAFTRVPTCSTKYPGHALYLAHRHGCTSSLSVRRGTQKDIPRVGEFLDAACGTGQQPDKIKDALSECDAEFEPVRQSGSTFFIVEAYDQVVGVSLVKHADVNRIAAEFDVERWIEPKVHDMQGRLTELQFLVLNPLFEGHARWILQDIMYLAESSVLLYECKPPLDYLSVKVLREEMVPLRPRRMARAKTCINWPVLLMTNNIAFEPRVTVNTRVVLVGASDCNLATIEELIFDDHIRYANLILISPEGYTNPGSLLTTAGLRTLPRPDCIGYPLYCCIISDSISSIVRRQQRVRLRKVGSVKYDQLVLSVGRAFAHKTLAPPSHDTSVSHIPNLIPMDLAHGHHLVKAKDRYPEGVIVVGAQPEAWHAVSVLIHNNYPPANITHIAGPTNSWPADLVGFASQFTDAYQRVGIQLLCLEPTGLVKSALDRVTAVTVPDGDQVKSIKCGLVVLASEKQVSGTNFRIIQEACLVFDNGIVIGSGFETSDPNILATGSCTRFSRREEIPWYLKDVSSLEVGQKAAKVLKPADLDVQSQRADPAGAPPPQYYTNPVERQAKVAGDLHFYSFTVPAPFVTAKDVKPRAELATNVESDNMDGRWIWEGFVDCLVYMSGTWGARMVDRFNDGLIVDLFDYLNQQQFDVVFSDRFQFAMEQMREAASHKDREVTKEEKDALLLKFESSGNQGRAVADRMVRDLFQSNRASA
ncbi:hypothetical protein BCR44DRAFT_1495377 [Catenaria anguillulae PL171]|uniref:Cilia- and flagella-associated protein 61 N-terminal domain-containing protein n=1 Tax=Catenaria anguillulae PL171 TaxID=765915 RepID=A0A1Y2I4H7_9FUNG|nr:hypothetical protein BCR44DRAFT_1495377 [Catenaria anguillulae PL171]